MWKYCVSTGSLTDLRRGVETQTHQKTIKLFFSCSRRNITNQQTFNKAMKQGNVGIFQKIAYLRVQTTNQHCLWITVFSPSVSSGNTSCCHFLYQPSFYGICCVYLQHVCLFGCVICVCSSRVKTFSWFECVFWRRGALSSRGHRTYWPDDIYHSLDVKVLQSRSLYLHIKLIWRAD